jgi:FtsZ-binding cell division protein ZapB
MKWRPESLERLRKAKKLDEAAKSLALDPDQSAPKESLALTELTKSLTKRLAEALSSLEGQKRWRLAARRFLEETESAIAAVKSGKGFGSDIERAYPRGGRSGEIDWGERVRSLSASLDDLSQKRLAQAAKLQDADRRLASALKDLESAEKKLAGDKLASILSRGEALAASVDSALRSTRARLAELADAWLYLPRLVGRPVFLDKIFLYAAVNLARAQNWLEELKTRLANQARRLSSSRDARLAARKVLNMDRDKSYPPVLSRASRRLDDLKAALNAKYREKAESIDAPPLAGPPFGGYGTNEGRRPISEERTLAAMSEQLGAVAAERDRLKEELLDLKERLVEAGQIKARLMKLTEMAKRALKAAAQEKEELSRKFSESQDQLALVRRRHANLKEQYDYGRSQFRKLSQAASDQNDRFKETTALKEEMALKLSRTEENLRALSDEKAALSTKTQELALAVDQARGQEAALAAELAGHQEELSEATLARERLGQIVTGYRQRMDKAIVAHKALMDSFKRRGLSLAQSEMEREEQKVVLARQEKALVAQVTKRHKLMAELAASQARLESMESERERLSQEIEAARAEAERTREEAKGSAELSRAELASAKEAEARLTAELTGLKDEIDYNLKPLIKLLGLALWRGEADNRRALKNADEELARFKKEAAAKEAGIRVQGAGKEIEYLERVSRQDKEIAKLRAERDALEAERGELLEAKEADAESDAWVVNQLSVALVASDLRHEKLNRSLKNLKGLLRSQKLEATSVKTELEELAKNQAQALKKHQAWLSELVPLVAFFLDSGLDFWTQSSSAGDARQAVLFFLREENAALSAELDKVREDRQGLLAERKSLLETQAGFKERLKELKGLLGFLIRQFADNAVALAQAIKQRESHLKQIADLLSGQADSFGAIIPDERQGSFKAQIRVVELEKENAALKNQMDEASVVLEKERANAAAKASSEERALTLLSEKEAELKGAAGWSKA